MEVPPLISVIIPAFNEEKNIRQLLLGLAHQVQPSGSFEVLLVNNGSTDGTLNVVRGLKFPGNYKLRIIDELKKSSYAARNLGVQESVRSQYVVFIDADCLPRKDWLCKGIQTMEDLNADLVGGHVEFKFSDRPSSAEMVDSFTNLQMQHGIEVGGYCRTANLFVKRSVFDTIGLFREVQSGEDIRWTKKQLTPVLGLSLQRMQLLVIQQETGVQ